MIKGFFIVVVLLSVWADDCCSVWSVIKVEINNKTCSRGCPPGLPCFARLIGLCCDNGRCIGRNVPHDYMCASSGWPNVTVNHKVPCIDK